jgi:hypothetical protein
MGTTPTMSSQLLADAVKRDLMRYRDSVDEAERDRIMKRMVDTVDEALRDSVDEVKLIKILIFMSFVI